MVFFGGGELRVWLHTRRQQAVDAVAGANVEALRFSPEGVTESIVERYTLEPVAYDWDNWSADAPIEAIIGGQQFGSPVRHAGQSVTIHVPVSGDTEILNMQASRNRLDGGFQGSLDTHAGEVTFTITDTSMTSEVINQRAEAMCADLEERTGWTNHDVAQWIPGLREAVLNAAKRRKQQLDAMAETSAGLSIPLRSAPGAQQVQIPVARKTVRVAKRAPAGGGAAEPALSDAIYEDVIRTVRALANSLERLPRTARRFKEEEEEEEEEEEFRDLILFVLNSNYEGLARGEVFNGAGRTDILLPYQDVNAFVGECKFWKGPKQFNEAINQLLGYTVWRDTKAALLLFIKTGDATSILARADAALRDHGCFVSARPAADSSDRADFLMHAVDDSSRHIKVALLPVVIRQPDD